MKKITLALIVLLATNTFAQQVYIEGGKTITSFDYKNTEGNLLENLQATTQSFMSLGYRDQVLMKNLNMLIGTSYNAYGAIGSDDAVGNYLEWNLNYLTLDTGLDYELFKIKKAQIYLKGTVSLMFLIQGTQTINNSVINLKNQENFDKPVFDFKAGFGISQPISNSLSFYVQYMYGKTSKSNFSPEDTNKEILRYISDNVSFGLLINIAKKRPTIFQ